MLRSALLVTALTLAAVLPQARADSYQIFDFTYTGTVQATGYDGINYPNEPVYTTYKDLSVPASITLEELVLYFPFSSPEIRFYAQSIAINAPQHTFYFFGPDLYLNFDDCEYDPTSCVYFDFDPWYYDGPLPAPLLAFRGSLDDDYTDYLTGVEQYHVADFSGDLHLVTATTPEPSTFALLGTGVLTLAGLLKRRKPGERP